MSITLTTPRKFSYNDAAVETDSQGAAVKMTVDFLANTATFDFHVGAVQGTPPNLNVGVYSKLQQILVDLNTGQWRGDPTPVPGQQPPQLSGQVPSTALNNFIAQLKADRNLSESFASGANNIMPGTQVPW